MQIYSKYISLEEIGIIMIKNYKEGNKILEHLVKYY